MDKWIQMDRLTPEKETQKKQVNCFPFGGVILDEPQKLTMVSS